MGKFYLAVVQAVLLYGSESWAINEKDWKRLRSFHNRSIRHITGEHIRKVGDRWEYPDQVELQKKCGLFSIETYVERQRGTLWAYFGEHRKELLEEAMGTERHSRDINKIMWWNQRYIDSKEDMGNEYFWYK